MARSFFNNDKQRLFKTALSFYRAVTYFSTFTARLRWLKLQIPQQLFCIFALALCQSTLADPRCDTTAATLESVEGVVEWTTTDDWQAAARGDAFCYGDKIRVLEQRAALRLANDTIVRLRENSVVTLLPEDKGFWIELLQGAGHFLSRTPKQLTIKAAYLNAAIDGTEFVVAVEEQRNRVAVFEGDVRVFNRYGEVRLADGTETSATATAAPDPARSIRLRDAAEWILYYPPLIIQNQANFGITALMDQERYGEALNALTQQNMTSENATLAASLALVSGQPAEADRLLDIALQQHPQSPDALALRALKVLTAGDDQTALSQTTALSYTHPQNISVLLAHAYALQSQGKIEEAVDVNRQALSLAPDNLFILARTAELELSTGNTRAARKLIDRALQKAPNHSRLNTLAGFIALNRFANKEAQTYFRTAITHNDSEPLARLGLALALIQKGKIEEGRAEMEMAVLLDPGSSLLRSYLGKTYAAQDQNDWADTQYQLAKNLDPNDPTPWFYQAHLKHEENKPGEALKLITTAIEKNDNRAVYRSRMLLDSDAAARSANLVGIYNNFGFNETAKQTAAIAASKNPTDFAAHQALVMAYGADTRAQVLRAREAFMARLLAPIGASELNIGAGETGLAVAPWVSPGWIGNHEYSSLFARRRIRADFSALGGNDDSRGYEWQLQALGNRVSISGGQYDYKTDGYRANNHLDLVFSEANLQYQISNDTKLYIRSTSLLRESGDFRNNANSVWFLDSQREENKFENYSIATSSSLTETHKLLILINHNEITTSNGNEKYQTSDWYVQNSTDESSGNYLYQAALFATQGKRWYQIIFSTEHFDTKRSKHIDEIYEGEHLDSTLSKITASSAHKAVYGQVNAPINNQTQIVIGVGQIWAEYKAIELGVSEAHIELNNASYDIGLRWHPSEYFSMSLANWDRTERRLPITDSLDRGMTFDINTTDNTGALARNLASAIAFSLQENNTNIILKSKHGKVISPKEIYSPGLRQIRTSQTSKNETEAYIEHPVNDALSLEYAFRYQRQDQKDKAINVPFKTKTMIKSLGFTLALNSHSSFSAETQHIDHENFSQDAALPQQEILREDAAFITNINYTINFQRNRFKVSLRAMNIFNNKIDIYHQNLDAQSESLIPTQPLIATNRTSIVSLSYQL